MPLLTTCNIFRKTTSSHHIHPFISDIEALNVVGADGTSTALLIRGCVISLLFGAKGGVARAFT
jgi:hypothetical protein